MTDHDLTAQILDPTAYNVDSLEDEIRVDHLCAELLRKFCLDLVASDDASPEEASDLGRGAAYFLCEFIVPHCLENIFHIDPIRVRQFAGNWYIVNNLEPNMVELTAMLTGVMAFYHYCAQLGKIEDETYEKIAEQCRQLDFYRQRVETFLDIKDDGFYAWNEACPTV
jgi:hypothetical protein